MLEQIRNAPWRDLYVVLSKGNPPLAIQFLLINFLFFMVYAVRRLRGHKTRKNNLPYLAHGLMFVLNMVILYQTDVYPIYREQVMLFWHKIQLVI
jgi:hypothetical protein